MSVRANRNAAIRPHSELISVSLGIRDYPGSWLACGKHILEKTESSGNAGGKLPKKGQACVNKNAVAVFAIKRAAFQIFFPRIVSREKRRVTRVPLLRKVKAPFLHPAGEIIFRNGVGFVHQWM